MVNGIQSGDLDLSRSTTARSTSCSTALSRGRQDQPHRVAEVPRAQLHAVQHDQGAVQQHQRAAGVRVLGRPYADEHAAEQGRQRSRIGAVRTGRHGLPEGHRASRRRPGEGRRPRRREGTAGDRPAAEVHLHLGRDRPRGPQDDCPHQDLRREGRHQDDGEDGRRVAGHQQRDRQAVPGRRSGGTTPASTPTPSGCGGTATTRPCRATTRSTSTGSTTR